MWAGGQWDRIERRFTDKEPESGQIILLEESQVDFTAWFAKWLLDYRDSNPRDVSLALAGGERRGGKTFDLLLCSIAAAIEVPNLLGWAVAKSFRERDEIDRTIRECTPTAWYQHRKAPEHVYQWANGSSTKIQSADDVEALKMGRADVIFLNEGQKMDAAALVNSLGGTIDKGGIALVAANPPRKQRGEWVLNLKTAIEEKTVTGCKFFGFSSKDNTKVDQAARGRFASIARMIDPLLAENDADGDWSPIGNVAYPKFRRADNVRPAPQLGDVTAATVSRKIGRSFGTVGGVDFQIHPHNAGVFIKIFSGENGQNIYHVIAEVLQEGSEDEFLNSVDEQGWTTDQVLWIGDASGTWQDAAHNKGNASFDVFKSRKWRIEAPRKKITTQGSFAANPSREDRVLLVNNLLLNKRLFVDGDKCPKLATALAKCEWRYDRPFGKYAHESDALGYALYFLEPRPKPAKGNLRNTAWSVPGARRNSDF